MSSDDEMEEKPMKPMPEADPLYVWSYITSPSLSDDDRLIVGSDDDCFSEAWVLLGPFDDDGDEDHGSTTKSNKTDDDAGDVSGEEDVDYDAFGWMNRSSCSPKMGTISMPDRFDNLPRNSKTSIRSSTPEGFISAFIRERVLHRLPATTLLRLRAVSSLWLQWIDNPFFAHSHAQAPHPISGVFYQSHSNCDPIYCPFNPSLDDLPNFAMACLPEPVRVIASARGLLCCVGLLYFRYYVINPITTEWAILPSPANYHGSEPAVVIAFEDPFAFNFGMHYFVVCAYQLSDDLSGLYGFETFSSRDWEWKASLEICAVERIEPFSGVTARGYAHWRTSMQTMVSYNPATDEARTVVWPASHMEETLWELAEVRNTLHCVCVRGTKATIYELGDEEQGWKEVKTLWDLKQGREDGGSLRPAPMRVQGGEEFLFWEDDGRLVARDLADRNTRIVDLGPVSATAFVPFVGSLIGTSGSGN